MKLGFLVGAVHWCQEQGRAPDCLDEFVRPMIVDSDNVATGEVLDRISGEAGSARAAPVTGYPLARLDLARIAQSMRATFARMNTANPRARPACGRCWAAQAASGDPMADDILSAWAEKRLVVRKSDDALFLAVPQGDGFALTALDGTPGGTAAKSATLESAVFGAELKRHIVHEVVRAELNAHRAGTRGAKTRGLVSGGRAKPWRQKGTGRARQGSSRSPQWTGGGVAHGPLPRDHSMRVNKKMKRGALRGALR